MWIVVCPFSFSHCVFDLSFFDLRILITPLIYSKSSSCGVASTSGRLTTEVWHYLHLWYVVWSLDIWKGISSGLSPFCSFICTRQTSYSGFQRKTMYWTLREWSMSNPRKFHHFILIRHPKWRSGDKAISSWMKLKKIKIVRMGEDTTNHNCVCAYYEQIEEEIRFCLLFYPGHSWQTGKTVKCFYALILIASTFLFMIQW